MLHYYVIDTETTGLKAGFHEVIQISAIRCTDSFQQTVNIKAEHPGRASAEALKIQNKTVFDLKHGIARSEAVKIIHEFLLEDEQTPAHRCSIGHNVAFDRRFLHAAWESEKLKFPADLWLCTKSSGRSFAKKKGIVKPKLSLVACMETAGLTPKSGAHNAVIDTINTRDLWNFHKEEKINLISLIKNVPHE